MSIKSAGEAVARIAFQCSDLVLSVQPSLQQDSAFSPTFRRYSSQAASDSGSAGISTKYPEIITLRANNDPLLSAFVPLRQGKRVAVTTTSDILLAGLPHLYKLAQYPLVIHVALHPQEYPDYAEITSIRNSGLIFLQSETLQEVSDIALSAHALSLHSGKAVLHYFDPANLVDDRPIPIEKPSLVAAILDLAHVGRQDNGVDEETNIYVDTGRQATILDETEIRLPEDDSAGIPEPVVSSKSNINSAASSPDSASRTSNMDDNQTASSASSINPMKTRPVNSEDVNRIIRQIWQRFATLTQRQYHPFEYSGPDDAEFVLFIFGSTGVFVDEILKQEASEDFSRVGIVTPRLYRPWVATSLRESIPSTVKRVAVLEQIKRATTRWGAVLIDVLGSLRINGTAQMPTLVGHNLRYIEPATARQALRGILQNLALEHPIQNLDIGATSPTIVSEALDLQRPGVEGAYMKILDQVFGTRLYIANQPGQTVHKIGPALAVSPEYSYGSLLARIDRRKRFVSEVQEAALSREFTTEAPKQWLSKWSLAADDVRQATATSKEVIARLETDGSPLAQHLLASKSLFPKESQWLIGSDAWAYDIGNSGVHHILASGANINMLIIDSQPWSERTAADSVRRKKDIGLYAMNFGNAYVASVAVYSSYTQVLEAMIEADKFVGPSVVLAYLPYNQENDSALTVLQETKKAVDLGYWPLYRWNPSSEEVGEDNFKLDSERIKAELEAFLRRDNRLTQLMNKNPVLAANLAESYGTEVQTLQKRRAKDAYDTLLASLLGAPLTILYASDNGNAESLAKRLGTRGASRGLKTKCLAMDDYPIEDLAGEENVVLITSTAGQGEFPQNGRAFWDALKSEATGLDLAGVNFTVFALGDSHYWPRKEDKLYYNKSGKDLDARLDILGAVRFIDIGMGDDQDPDGYHTAYNEWEPKVWQYLHVDKVEGLPEEPPPLTNEDIKIGSNFLRGTIEEGLADPSTGAISASDQQLTKFHGTYMQDDRDLRDERKAQGLEPAYSFMIRCRLAAGVATPEQWLQMDEISHMLGNRTMKLTTRQTFQFHGVIKGKLKPAMRAINKALMTTIAACGDVNRNVMCSIMPTDSAYHREVYEVSKKVSDHLLPSTTAYHEIWLEDPAEGGKKVKIGGDALVDAEPLYGPTYLPRKFKITIAIPPHNDTDVYAHDIGLIAIKGDDGHLEGFNILAGGGMGVTHNNKKTYPRTGSMLGYSPADTVHIVCEKIMLVQRDNGDRTNRKHARLKYTIDDLGVEVFKSKVEDLLEYRLAPARDFHFDSNIDTFGWQKDENGLHHYTFFIENGRIEDTPDLPLMTGLRELARIHKGEFRLTGNQHLCMSNVSSAARPAIEATMKAYKLDTPHTSLSGLRLSSSACVAFPTCGLAMAESERYLPKLIDLLEASLRENGLGRDSIVMRMTGCPNGCARPWLAEIGFVGKAFGAYNMYLGGGYAGNRLSKLYRSSIGEEEILAILKPIFKEYAEGRGEGERFGDWVIRAGYVKATLEGKSFHEDVAEDEEE